MKHKCLASLYLLSIATAQGAVPESTGDKIADRTCLFLDDRFIADQIGVSRQWHQGKPMAEPALKGAWPNLFGSVFFDPAAKVYRMYYEDLFEATGWILYAESTDGKHWTKPELGLIEIGGSKANNCVWRSAELPNVFIDEGDPDPKGRLKMLIWSQPFDWHGIKFSRHVVLRSADGIHWEPLGQMPGPEPTDDSGRSRFTRDTHQVIWDKLQKRYLGMFRTMPSQPGMPGYFRQESTGQENSYGLSGHRRAVGMSSSTQLLSARWAHINDVLFADDRDDAKAAKFGRDPNKYDFSELYIMPFFVYGNHYLGIVSLLMRVDESDTVPGTGDLQLTYSHDGRYWHRQPNRQTLFAPSPLNWVPCYAQCSEPLDLGDEMLIYYTESTATHVGFEINQTQRVAEGRGAVIRGAAWRKDGFVSLEARGKGSVTTTPVLIEGSRLYANFSPLTKGGTMRVCLVDTNGTAIKGFSLDDSVAVSGDAVAQEITWRSGASLAMVRSQPVRIRFELEQANLWSFRVAE